MPPAKRTAVETIEIETIPYGTLCNLVVNGQVLPNYAYLGTTDLGLKFRANMQLSPQTELVLIPFHAIERIGLVGQR